MKREKVINQLINELEETDNMKNQIKSQSMIYQYDLKAEVAKALGLTFEQVDLPFSEWEAIRNKYLNERR